MAHTMKIPFVFLFPEGKNFWVYFKNWINTFHNNVPFLYHLKMSENLRKFQGV